MNPVHLDLFLWLLFWPFVWLGQQASVAIAAAVIDPAIIWSFVVVAIVTAATLVCCGGLAAWGMVVVGLALWRDRHQ
jgi:hypothetical protein